MSLALESYLSLITGVLPGEIPTASEANRVRQFLVLLYRVVLSRVFQSSILLCDPARCVYDDAVNRIDVPTTDLPIVGLVGGYPVLMGVDLEYAGTVASANTTSIVDAGTPGDDGAWVRAYVVFTSGTQSGEVRRVTGFNGTTGALTWETPLAQAPAALDTFVVTYYYVSDLTVGATNYVFARKGSDTVSRGIVEFHASTSATVPANEILVATAVLDGSGACTSYTDAPQTLAAGVGAYDTLTGTGSIEILAGQTATITISHNALMLLGGITVALTTNTSDGTVDVTQYYKDDEFVFEVTNDSAYTLTFAYSWTRKGRLLRYGA